MENQKINRAVASLLSDVKKYEGVGLMLPNIIRERFVKIYESDPKFDQMSKHSVLIMFRLNLRYRFILLHVFGGEIELCGKDKNKHRDEQVHGLKVSIEED